MELRYFETDTKIQEELGVLIEKGALIPIIGAGFSQKSLSLEGYVPSATDVLTYMKEYILKNKDITKEELENSSFSEIATIFEDTKYGAPIQQRRSYIKNNFTGVRLPDLKKQFIRIKWPKIYTLNIDDGIEQSFDENIIPILPFDSYNEEHLEREFSIIKLHGDAVSYLQNDKEVIFNKSQYIRSVNENRILLSLLRKDLEQNNIIYIGTSLDEDELDLLVVSHKLQKFPELNTKIYFLAKKEPTISEKIKLTRRFGITDCIIVSNFDDFYRAIVSQYEKYLSTQKNPLQFFFNTPIRQVAHDKNENEKFLQDRHYPFKFLTNQQDTPYIIVPKFIVDRDSYTTDIIKNLEKNNIVVIFGHKISGKTFVLLNVLRALKGQPVYFFPETFEIDNISLDNIIKSKNSILIFDQHSLTDYQVEHIVSNINVLKENDTKVLLTLSTSDTKAEHLFEGVDVAFIKIDNLLTPSDVSEINRSLRKLGLKVFEQTGKEKVSLLDHLISINAEYSTIINIHTSFSQQEILLLLLLAYHDELSFAKIQQYNLDEAVHSLYKKVDPAVIFESITVNIARSNQLQQSKKYIVNAKYIILKWLATTCMQDSGLEKIREAYIYLISVLKDLYPNNYFDHVKPYIRFVELNEIFGFQRTRESSIITAIYDSLAPFLSNFYNFHHQRAIHMYRTNNSNINKAMEYIDLAENYVNSDMNRSLHKNHKLQISLAHICFTKACILCKKTTINNFNIHDTIVTLAAIDKAFKFEENWLDLKNEHSDMKQIKKFIIHILSKEFDKSLLSKKSQDSLSEIATIIFKREQKRNSYLY